MESEISVVTETAVRQQPLNLTDLTRHLEDAEAEARTARQRARLLRMRVQDEKRRLRRSNSVMSSGSLGRTLSVGVLAGVGAGISLALFVMVMNAILGDGFLDWLRYSAAIALGRSVLSDSAPLTVLVIGLILHLSLAGLYGATFAVAARYISFLRRDLLVATTLFGLGIWVLNFYVFSPWLFPWFDDSHYLVQFVAHTVFYGMPLGVILLEFTPSGGILASNRVRP
jgi:hypothetical protein